MGSALPNILLIVADDLNSWIGALERYPRAHTPNLDALARRGTLFRRAYCTAPHCNPSRTSLFSGLRPSQSGVYHGERLTISGDAVRTLPESLRARGYETFAAGKVFHGHFDYEHSLRHFETEATWRDSHGRAELWDHYHTCIPEPLPEGRPLNGLGRPLESQHDMHWYSHFDWGPLDDERRLPDDVVCEQACHFLESERTRPFLCAVGFYRPHLPWYVPRRFFDLHPLDRIEIPPVRPEAVDALPPMARAWAHDPGDHERIVAAGQWERAIQGYLAASSYCDEKVGKIMASLDASGRWDDTLVLFMGDNGFHLGEKLHWRKFTLWEEATRVPLIAAGAGTRAGAVVETPVSLLDLFPTLGEATGAPVPPDATGESLLASLTNPEAERASLPIATWGAGNHSIRSPRWRYTRYVDGSEELYDHDRDPYEWENLAGNPELAEARRELGARIDDATAPAPGNG